MLTVCVRVFMDVCVSVVFQVFIFTVDDNMLRILTAISGVKVSYPLSLYILKLRYPPLYLLELMYPPLYLLELRYPPLYLLELRYPPLYLLELIYHLVISLFN